jgi:transposase InsO family protein
MPWEVSPVSEIRLAFVHHVLTLRRPVAAACRDFGVSRTTAYKWLARYRAGPAQALADRPRRPHHSPQQTPAVVEQAILEVRDRFGWGPRKIHAHLIAQGAALPSARTVAAVLRRPGRVGAAPPPPDPPQRFERAAPNQLWQCDFKGRLEVGRRRVYPFTALDDHSRFLLALRPCLDQTMATAWAALWDAFGEFGLPDAVLCDNAFGSPADAPGVSWFEARLLRLGIRPVHGRPYHPQTQGKVERLHGTLQRELWPRARRDSLDHFAADLDAWRTAVYNPVRPHEALGDVPPLARWRPSDRRRPAQLPAVEYPPGSVLRKVSTVGDVRWRRYRILAGRGLVGEYVRVEEADGEVLLHYAATEIRRLRLSGPPRGPML